jgi:hypothetical protein
MVSSPGGQQALIRLSHPQAFSQELHDQLRHDPFLSSGTDLALDDGERRIAPAGIRLERPALADASG